MAILWSIAWWIGVVIGIVIGVLVAVLILLLIAAEIHYRFFYDEWKDTMIDEAEMLDADDAFSEMEKEGWSRERRKLQCRADIESGWRRVAQARALYDEAIVEEVRKEMEGLGVKPGWSRRQKEYAKNR